MAVNDNGNLQYWYNGFPIRGIKKGSLDTGGLQYWSNGFPFRTIFPTTTTSLIKTVDGLAIANVKTVNGLAIASVKTIMGLTNV